MQTEGERQQPNRVRAKERERYIYGERDRSNSNTKKEGNAKVRNFLMNGEQKERK